MRPHVRNIPLILAALGTSLALAACRGPTGVDWFTEVSFGPPAHASEDVSPDLTSINFQCTAAPEYPLSGLTAEVELLDLLRDELVAGTASWNRATGIAQLTFDEPLNENTEYLATVHLTRGGETSQISALFSTGSRGSSGEEAPTETLPPEDPEGI